VIEFVSGLDTPTGRPLDVRGLLGSHDVPCVLNSSLQWGDHCSEVIAVCSGTTCNGCGIADVVFTVNTRILPSGNVEPVASRSGCQGHHESAYTGSKYNMRETKLALDTP
jgi:hypothetical protein